MSGSSTCAGACCSVFPLDPWQVEQMRRGAHPDPASAYILDMVIPLTYEEARARTDRLGYTWPANWPDSAQWGGEEFYTCRHWDEATRLCTAYEARPNMCRNYPYGVICERGCGYAYDPNPSPFIWDAQRNGWAVVSNDRWDWDGEVLRQHDARQSTKSPRPTKPRREARGDGRAERKPRGSRDRKAHAGADTQPTAAAQPRLPGVPSGEAAAGS